MGAPLKDTLVSQLYVFGRSKARQPSLINHFRPSPRPLQLEAGAQWNRRRPGLPSLGLCPLYWLLLQGLATWFIPRRITRYNQL